MNTITIHLQSLFNVDNSDFITLLKCLDLKCKLSTRTLSKKLLKTKYEETKSNVKNELVNEREEHVHI